MGLILKRSVTTLLKTDLYCHTFPTTCTKRKLRSTDTPSPGTCPVINSSVMLHAIRAGQVLPTYSPTLMFLFSYQPDTVEVLLALLFPF